MNYEIDCLKLNTSKASETTTQIVIPKLANKRTVVLSKYPKTLIPILNSKLFDNYVMVIIANGNTMPLFEEVIELSKKKYIFNPQRTSYDNILNNIKHLTNNQKFLVITYSRETKKVIEMLNDIDNHTQFHFLSDDHGNSDSYNPNFIYLPSDSKVSNFKNVLGHKYSFFALSTEIFYDYTNQSPNVFERDHPPLMEQKVLDLNMGRIFYKEFKRSDFCINPNILIIGKRGSRKMKCVFDIITELNKIHNYHHSVIYTNVAEDNCNLTLFGQVCNNIDINHINTIVRHQKEYVKECKNNNTIPRNLLIYINDPFSNVFIKEGKEIFRELYINGRSYYITLITTLQFSLTLAPELRANLDYVLLADNNSNTEIKKYFDHYAGIYPNLNTFKDQFQTIHKENDFMLINNRSYKNNISHKVYTYNLMNNHFNKSFGKNNSFPVYNSSEIPFIMKENIEPKQKINIKDVSPSSNNITIRKLDPTKLINKRISVVGIAKSGKKFLIKDIINKMRNKFNFDFGVIFSAKEKFYNLFENQFQFVSSKKGNQFNEQIEHLINHQEKTCNKIIVVFDNLHTNDLTPSLLKLFEKAPSLNITLIISNKTGIFKNHLLSFDYLIQGYTWESSRTKTQLYSDYGFGKKDVYNQIINSVTPNYGFLCTYLSAEKPEFNDVVFWYKASFTDKPIPIKALPSLKELDEKQKRENKTINNNNVDIVINTLLNEKDAEIERLKKEIDTLKNRKK